MRILIVILLLQSIVIQLHGQADHSFHPPIGIPMILSGNFGEIRSDHFHSGIDIKTRGSIGHPVFSIEEGHVSRIKVQANGYGKSIYIDHPSGHTSVYGHLDRYRDDIAEFVRSMQYKRRSHTLDLYLKPGQFSIEKGDVIAYSGNTGGSSGPHLHFEIRSSGNQHPTNVLTYGFDIADRVSPRFHSLSIQPSGEKSTVNGKREKQTFRVVRDQGIYKVPYGTALRASGKIGIGVEVFDYLDGASNRCGVYSLKMFLDGAEVYSLNMDEFAFSETRYINAHIDYEALIRSNKKVRRLHRLPNDRLRIYGKLQEDGWIEVNDEHTHHIRVVAEDVAGNTSALEFEISGDTNVPQEQEANSGGSETMHWNEANNFQTNEVEINLPARALYEDIQFSFSKSPGSEGLLSAVYHIHHPEIPVHLPYTLSIKYAPADPGWKDKLMMVTYNEDDELEEAGGAYENGSVVATPRSFGRYAIAVDTVAPEIKPHGKLDQAIISGASDIRFTIRDNLSGIEDYEGYIDNQWALFEYDPKNDLLIYTFDRDRVKSDKQHELELYVTDAKGNVNLYHTTFTW
jgi:hypothetical protein